MRRFRSRAHETPYEQWLAGTTPAPYIDAADFINRRDLWFGSPRRHFFALTTPNLAMPNLIRLNDLGPRARPTHRARTGTWSSGR